MMSFCLALNIFLVGVTTYEHTLFNSVVKVPVLVSLLDFVWPRVVVVVMLLVHVVWSHLFRVFRSHGYEFMAASPSCSL